MWAVLWLVPCTVLSCVLVKMSGSRPSKTQQGKVISLFIVIATVGILLVTTSYKGILSNPLHGFNDDQTQEIISSSSNVVVSQDFMKKPLDNVVIQEQLRQHEEAPLENTVEKAEEKEIIVEKTGDTGGNMESEFFYGVMIDAGSTGSRVHAFKFKHTTPGKPFHLEDALFKFNHHGLSSFADEPKKGAESIGLLLDEAKAYIPESQWSHTPLALKATAGLRALPREESDALLKEVDKLFQSSPFKVGANAVTIMDGDEEGIFSWFTLNFLMGALGDIDKMVGAMDLGGGSTQITFVTTSQKNKAEYVEEMDIFGHNFSLYTHSYLGLGLMAGRFQTLGGKEPASEESGPFTTPCVATGKTFPFVYQGETFNVTGSDVSASSRFVECQKHTDGIVKAGNIDQPPQVHTLAFTIFSYYYDRAVDALLIGHSSEEPPDSSKGGVIKVKDFIKAAKKECELLQGKEFLCLDLTYISSLLKTGFGFSEDTEVSLQKKVDQFEISWALGAMFHLLKH